MSHFDIDIGCLLNPWPIVKTDPIKTGKSSHHIFHQAPILPEKFMWIIHFEKVAKILFHKK